MMFRSRSILSSPTSRRKPPCAHPVRRLLWRVALPMTAFVLLMVVTEVRARMSDPSTRLSLGHDLLPSYAAGQLTLQGRPRGMYDRDMLSQLEFQIIDHANLELSGRYGPFLNPPFFAWLFVPLAMLPYRQAALTFLIFNIGLFVLTLGLLTKMLQTPPLERRVIEKLRDHSQAFGGQWAGGTGELLDWRTTALVPLLSVLALPLWQAMGHQQNTFISLFLMTSSVICCRANRGFFAGIFAGLLFFKPQLAAVFAMALVIAAGWRALAGIAVTGAALLVITLVTMPGCLSAFLIRLPPILHDLQVAAPYNWGRQVTFHSFYRLLLQGHVRGETALAARMLSGISIAVVGSMLVVVSWRFWSGGRTAIARDRLLAAAIVSMPTLMPYYMDYDLLLLAVPAVLLAGEWIRRRQGITKADRRLLAAWVMLGIESHFNPGVAGGSHFNMIVPLLAVLSGLHLWRCIRPESAVAAVVSQNPAPLSRAA